VYSFFQAEDGIRAATVTGVQTCALPISGRENLMGGEMELKAADPGDGAGRGADFRRIVGERSDVVAVERDGIGELAAGNLHAVKIGRASCRERVWSWGVEDRVRVEVMEV